LLSDLERLEDQEYRSKNLIGQINWILALCLSDNLSDCSQKLSNGQVDLSVVEQDSPAQMAERFSGLGKLFESQDSRQLPLQKIQKGTEQMFYVLNQWKHDADKTQVNKYLADLKQLWSTLIEQRSQLLRLDRQSYSVTFSQSEQARTQLYRLALVITGADFILAIALIYVFRNSIGRRLKILTDNTARFASGQPLHEVVSGQDELTDYDQTFHDMADRLAESARKEQAARDEVERLKREFMTMVSHDLRSPLTTVGGTIELVSTGRYGELNDNGLKLLARSRNEIDRLTSLVQDLLDIASIESGKLDLDIEPLALEEIIQRAKSSVEGLASRKNIAIISEETQLQILADEGRIVQVLVNLLGNAIKFSGAGTTVKISSRLIDSEVEISVEDHGRGIPESHLNLVFDRFQQVERSDASEKGGTGLGLAICKSIVEQHGGTIELVSELGAGTTVSFRIPAI
jgi:signal transduction histidine kinase